MKHTVTVVPLGPGSPDLLTLQAVNLLNSGKLLYLRTERHPVAELLKSKQICFSALDRFYDNSEDFDEMNSRIVRLLLSEAESEDLLYAVPDPSSDRTVNLLVLEAEKNRVTVQVLPGVSAADSCLSVCSAFSDLNQIQIVTALGFSSFPWNPTVSLLITELDSRLLAGEVKLKLSALLEDLMDVYFIFPSEETIRKTTCFPLCELDRQKKYDQTAAVFVPGSGLLQRKRFCFDDLVAIMDRLRAMDGCPWDRAQDHHTLKPYLVEEAWEAVDAIDKNDMDHLADELGDVLLQVVFHAAVAESFDEFDFTDVATAICRKMILRHPNLFPNASVQPEKQMQTNPVLEWEKLKQKETGSKTLGESLDDVSSSLPALKYAIKVNKKLSQLPSMCRNPEEIAAEIRHLAASVLGERTSLDPDMMGNLLICCMELCRMFDMDGEVLLHESVNRLKKRFRQAEKAILDDGKKPENLTRTELDAYLNRT